MPHKKSAIKHLRQIKKLTAKNLKIKGDLKTLIKKTRQALAVKKIDQAKELISKAIKSLDRAAQKKIIKKNTAARRKSQLMKAWGKLTQSK